MRACVRACACVHMPADLCACMCTYVRVSVRVHVHPRKKAIFRFYSGNFQARYLTLSVC